MRLLLPLLATLLLLAPSCCSPPPIAQLKDETEEMRKAHAESERTKDATAEKMRMMTEAMSRMGTAQAELKEKMDADAKLAAERIAALEEEVADLAGLAAGGGEQLKAARDATEQLEKQALAVQELINAALGELKLAQPPAVAEKVKESSRVKPAHISALTTHASSLTSPCLELRTNFPCLPSSLALARVRHRSKCSRGRSKRVARAAMISKPSVRPSSSRSALRVTTWTVPFSTLPFTHQACTSPALITTQLA